jgi:hypothetical protein
MLRILPSLLIILSALPAIQAQHFSFQPDRLHEATASAIEYSNHIIFIENLTGGELILGWEKISVDFPGAWDADLCDYVGCYLGIPDNGTMSPIYDTIQGFLKLTINPNNTPGTGIAVFRVFDNKHPEVTDTCTFIIHATELTSMAERDSKDILRVYPIPADDYLFAGHSLNKSVTLTIYDAQGRTWHKDPSVGQRDSKINLRNYPAGLYLVVLSSNEEIIERKKILIQ